MIVGITDTIRIECYLCTSCFAELQINFAKLDYSINEDDSVLDLITMQFRRAENDFTLKLTPVSIANESVQDVVACIDPNEEARASPGERW